MMKRKVAALMMLTLTMGLFSGCAGTPVVYYTECNCTDETHTHAGTTDQATLDQATTQEEVLTEGALKTGLAIVTSVAKSENAKVADYDVTQVAVLVDDSGVIQDCIIDGMATKINFDENGVITDDLNTEILTKNELGSDYGMVAYGGAIAEWDVQADALAQYAVGKTVEELKSGAVDETGKAPEGSDLATSATIYLGGYVAAIEEAAANAKHLGAQAGDELRLTSINSIESSVNASAEAEGTAQLDSNVTAITVKEGIVTSCYIDSLQAKVSFDQKGVISTNLEEPVKTKNQLGADYGMVAWGGAIAEWDEQAAAFAAYVTGKNAEEIAGISVNEKTAPAEADLSTSVTISIGGFQELLHKALQ